MTKTVWIINQYASTPATGVGGRHYYMAKEMAKLGHKVYVIGSASHHLLRKKPDFGGHFLLEEVEGFKFVWVKMPEYDDAHSKQRALNWFIFPWRLKKLLSFKIDKPDTIMCSSPSLLSFLGAQYLSKKLQARLVFEVRDIWPLSLTEIGGVSSAHPLIRLMQWVEDRAYRSSDAVISNLKNSVQHMSSRGLKSTKFTWIANGFSLDEVTMGVPLNVGASRQLPQNKFIVGYTGTLGVANALDTLIEAAYALSPYEDIAFALVGGGKEKVALKALVDEMQLRNVFFIDPIPKVEIQAMLKRFDVCYLGLTKDPVFRFGVSPNKLFDYLYSGRPIIYGIDSGDYKPVVEAGAGLQIEAQNSDELAASILKIYQMTTEEKALMGRSGRNAAEEQYEYGQLAKKLAGVLFES